VKIAAWMPLKRESRRLPGKNFLHVGGQPLCHWVGGTMVRLRETGSVDEAYLFGADETIRREARFLPMIQWDLPDNATASEMAQTVARVLDADIYVCLFATAPFLSMSTIRKCIDAVRWGEPAAVTCRRMNALAWIDGEPNYDLLNVPAASNTAAIDAIVSGCIAYSAESLKQTGMMIPRDATFIPVEWPEWIDIDSPEDLKLAEVAAGWGVNCVR